MLKRSIKAFITRHSFLFCVFAVFHIITIMAVMYAYCQGRQINAFSAYYYRDASIFSVRLSQPRALRDEVGFIASDEDKAGDIKLYYGMEPEIAAFPLGNKLIVHMGREAREGPEAVITSAEYNRRGLAVGDEIELLGESFKIVGARNGVGYIEIPYGYAQNLPCYGVDVTLPYLPTAAQALDYAGYLQGLFHDGAVIPPPERDYKSEYAINSDTLEILFVFLLSVFNIYFLYSYIMGKRKGQYAVARICGCSALRGFAIFTLELLIYLAAFIAVAAGLFAGVSGLLFNEGYYVAGAKDIAIASALYIAASLVVFLPKLYSYASMTALNLRKRD